jgi:hypothetical protein
VALQSMSVHASATSSRHGLRRGAWSAQAERRRLQPRGSGGAGAGPLEEDDRLRKHPERARPERFDATTAELFWRLPLLPVMPTEAGLAAP